MLTVGLIEKRTQARVVTLFRDRLKYEYLGNWLEREGPNLSPLRQRTRTIISSNSPVDHSARMPA
jgi:hypothetical protein